MESLREVNDHRAIFYQQLFVTESIVRNRPFHRPEKSAISYVSLFSDENSASTFPSRFSFFAAVMSRNTPFVSSLISLWLGQMITLLANIRT